MAKRNTKTPKRLIQIPGVTNYDKLRSNNPKSNTFKKFNPLMSQKYNDLVKDNHEGESLDQRYLDEQVYQQLLFQSGAFNNTRFGANRKTSFMNLDPKSKRSELIRLSSHDQLDEILTKLTDELIVTDQHQEKPVSLEIDRIKLEALGVSKTLITKLEKSATEAFDDIFYMFGFGAEGTNTSMWNKMYLFLIEGSQAYEIVYDDINNPKKIIGINEIDALSLDDFYYDGLKYYRHYRELATTDNYVLLHNNQVVKINWADGSPNNRFSYIEQLIKSFNNARIIDESSIRWTVMNTMYRMIFKVPGKGKSRIGAAQTLATEMNRMRDEIEYDAESGELHVNGSNSPQFSKEYWMINGDGGTPEIDNIAGSGPAFNSTELNDHFAKKLYRNAKMPFSRYDSSSSESWNVDTRSMLREEINFGRFCNRVRSIYKMLLLHPVYLQIGLDIPEIQEYPAILKAIKIRFNSYNVFEELMKIDILTEKADGIRSLHEAFTLDTPDGQTKPKFALEFLISEFMPDIDEEKLKVNEKMLKKEQKELLEWQQMVNTVAAEHARELAQIESDAAETGIGPELDNTASSQVSIDTE